MNDLGAARLVIRALLAPGDCLLVDPRPFVTFVSPESTPTSCSVCYRSSQLHYYSSYILPVYVQDVCCVDPGPVCPQIHPLSVLLSSVLCEGWLLQAVSPRLLTAHRRHGEKAGGQTGGRSRGISPYALCSKGICSSTHSSSLLQLPLDGARCGSSICSVTPALNPAFFHSLQSSVGSSFSLLLTADLPPCSPH